MNLSEGSNSIVTQAVDTAGNSTNLPRTVVLDTAPPALTITYPPDHLITKSDVISVTGHSEVGATVAVSNTLATVDPATGDFGAWVLLSPGTNAIPTTATDLAGNTTLVTNSVTLATVSCYTLSRTYTGSGGDPVASPANSTAVRRGSTSAHP